MNSKKATFKFLAGIGYASRGLIYVTLGILAIMKVASYGGEFTNSKGAIKTLHDTEFGFTLLCVLCAGLIGYVIWRATQAIIDVDDHGNKTKGIAIRMGLFTSAISHSALAFFTYKVLSSGSSSSGGKKEIVSQIMNLPFGQIMVSIIGVIFIIFGVAQIIKAAGEKYEKRIQFSKSKRFLNFVSKSGLAGRAVTFCLIGSFLIYAASIYDPDESGGLSEVWKFLHDMAFGNLIVLIVASSLFLFGIYSFIEAFYRKVDV